MRAVLLAIALFACAVVLAGCSSQTVMIGNIASCFVVFGLFYSTINLRRGEG